MNRSRESAGRAVLTVITSRQNKLIFPSTFLSIIDGDRPSPPLYGNQKLREFRLITITGRFWIVTQFGFFVSLVISLVEPRGNVKVTYGEKDLEILSVCDFMEDISWFFCKSELLSLGSYGRNGTVNFFRVWPRPYPFILLSGLILLTMAYC